MTFRDKNPDHENSKITISVTINKAPLIDGGVALQREMNMALFRDFDLNELIEEAVCAVEQRAREAMERAVAEQNTRRVALGLPPLVPAKPGEEPELPPSEAKSDEGTAAPSSPYRSRGRRKRGTENDPPAAQQPAGSDAA